jgi:zinc/manganese transport system permease protein
MTPMAALPGLGIYPIYPIMAALRPFSPNLLADIQQMLSFGFMRDAFLAGTLIAVTAGLVGYYVVLRHQTFAGDALSHVGFAGAMAAVFAGISPYVGLFVSTVLVALGMDRFGGTRALARARDTAIGTVLAWVLGMGALFLGLYIANPSATANPNIAVGVGFLFGSIFGIDAESARVIALVGTATSLALLLIARPLLFASIDPDVAEARGQPVWLFDALFMVLLAISIAEAVPAVGALLVFALLVTPAATAHRLVTRPYVALALSASLAVGTTWLGLTIAFYLPYPVSFDITMLGFITYLFTLGWRRYKWVTRRALARP